MKLIVKTIFIVLFAVTFIVYIVINFSITEGLTEILSNFTFSTEAIQALFFAMSISLGLTRDFLYLLMFEVLVIIACKSFKTRLN